MEKHELVDKDGKNTGIVLTHIEARDRNNIPEGYYIAVAGSVIVNSKNEVLLQKRSKFKRVNPGKWGICGGKINYGETPLDACVRETAEEIGINLNKENLKFLISTIIGRAHFTSYYIRQDIDISKCKLQEEEVDEVRFFKLDELENLDTEGIEWLEDLKRFL